MVVAERQDVFTTAFDALRRDAAFGSGGGATAREAAFQRFLSKGLPTTRDEEWKFTNIALVGAQAYAPAPRLVASPESLAAFEVPGAIRVVLVNGRLAASLSSLQSLPAGVSVRGEGDAREPGAVRGHAISDLNGAFFAEELTVTVDAKTIVTAPIHIVSVSMSVDAPVLNAPRLRIDVGEHAQVSIIETHVSTGSAPIFATVVTDVHVGASAVVNHVKLQREQASAFHFGSLFIRLDRAGTFTSCAVTLGGRIARNDITATLDGEGAECTLNGLYVADGETLVDTHTTIDHARAHCPSHEVYRGILSGRARAVFNGKIIVRQDAQKTDAKQTNRALLLSDDAQINTKPQLEIFADDVKCTHGAAIGQLDEDAMFYLRARGIAEFDARNMLLHAFAGEVIDGIPIEAVRDVAMKGMEAKLGVA